MFEKLDLTELSDADIGFIQEAFSNLALQRNRLAVDTLVFFLREICRRHGPGTATEGYADQELANVMRLLTTAIDAARENGMQDDEPILETLLRMCTAVLDELEARGCVQQMQ